MVFRRIRDLREDSDKTQIEIADYLNITEDAAYKRLRRARNALAKRIEGERK